MKNKLFTKALPALLLAAAIFAGCGTPAESGGGASSAAEGANATQAAQYLNSNTLPDHVKEEDVNAEWDLKTAAQITLNGESASVKGGGASANGSVVTISAAGTYVVSGALENGQIIIEAEKEDLVRLVLNGTEIHSDDSAPIWCKSADKLVVILADGTQNILSDSEERTAADSESAPSAALFSKADLSFTGGGSLTVNAAYNNGIATNDDLIIAGGTYAVTAAHHAIRGKDSATVLDGVFTLNAGGDGIQTNNDTNTEKGWTEIYGGDFDIESENDAIQAETSLEIYGGSFNITAGGGYNGGAESAEPASSKGLKAGTDLTVESGVFSLNCADDGVHSNSTATINGGEFTIYTGDDGMHADESLIINSGTIKIPACYEGLEAAYVTINGGDINIIASDDAINAAGGASANGGQKGEGRFGPDNFAQMGVAGDYKIIINGGTIELTAETGDGLDSNGDIEIHGGTILIHGPLMGGGEGAVDMDGTFTVTGGTLMGASTNAYAVVGPSASSSDQVQSTQAGFVLYFTNSYSGGTNVDIKDADGKDVLSFAPQTQFKSIIVTSPEMAVGKAYTVYVGGEELCEVNVSEVLTRITDTGEDAKGMDMMDGRGGRGGGREGFEMPEGWADGEKGRPAAPPEGFDFDGSLPDGAFPGGDFAGEPPEGFDGMPEQEDKDSRDKKDGKGDSDN